MRKARRLSRALCSHAYGAIGIKRHVVCLPPAVVSELDGRRPAWYLSGAGRSAAGPRILKKDVALDAGNRDSAGQFYRSCLRALQSIIGDVVHGGTTMTFAIQSRPDDKFAEMQTKSSRWETALVAAAFLALAGSTLFYVGRCAFTSPWADELRWMPITVGEQPATLAWHLQPENGHCVPLVKWVYLSAGRATDFDFARWPCSAHSCWRPRPWPSLSS